jgi:hypothetical protein
LLEADVAHPGHHLRHNALAPVRRAEPVAHFVLVRKLAVRPAETDAPDQGAAPVADGPFGEPAVLGLHGLHVVNEPAGVLRFVGVGDAQRIADQDGIVEPPHQGLLVALPDLRQGNLLVDPDGHGLHVICL